MLVIIGATSGDEAYQIVNINLSDTTINTKCVFGEGLLNMDNVRRLSKVETVLSCILGDPKIGDACTLICSELVDNPHYDHATMIVTHRENYTVAIQTVTPSIMNQLSQ